MKKSYLLATASVLFGAVMVSYAMADDGKGCSGCAAAAAQTANKDKAASSGCATTAAPTANKEVAGCAGCGTAAAQAAAAHKKGGCGESCACPKTAAAGAAQNVAVEKQGWVGQAAPDFKLMNHNGEPVSLSGLKGKPVVLVWFNMECPFVVYHYKDGRSTINDLVANYAEKGVTVLGINSTHNHSVEANKATAEKFSVKHAILDDSSGEVGRLYKATRTPEVFIVDAEGKIVYHGALDNAPNGRMPADATYVNFVANALDELLADKPITVSSNKPYGCTVKFKAPAKQG